MMSILYGANIFHYPTRTSQVLDLTASGNIDLGTGNMLFSGTTLTAASYSNFPTTLDGSITFVGTNTVTANGHSSLTVTDRSNLVDGLTLEW